MKSNQKSYRMDHGRPPSFRRLDIMFHARHLSRLSEVVAYASDLGLAVYRSYNFSGTGSWKLSVFSVEAKDEERAFNVFGAWISGFMKGDS